MLAALASFGVMVSVMNLSGYVVVEHHHHAPVRRLPGDRGARARDVRARARRRRADRPHRAARPALAGGPAGDGASRRSGCCGSTACSRPRCCCSGSAWAGTCRSWPRPRRWSTSPARQRARAPDRLQRPALGAARREPGAARRLRAGLDRRRRAGDRRDRDRRRARCCWLAPRRRSAGRRLAEYSVAPPQSRLPGDPMSHAPRAHGAHPHPPLEARPPRCGRRPRAARRRCRRRRRSRRRLLCARHRVPAGDRPLHGAQPGVRRRRLDARVQRRGRQVTDPGAARRRSRARWREVKALAGRRPGRRPVRRGRRDVARRPAGVGRRALQRRADRDREGRRRGADGRGRDGRARRRRRSPRAAC